MVFTDRKAYRWVACLMLGALYFPSFFADNCLAGKKLPEFEAQEEEVYLLSERVSEAKRISIMV